MKLYLGTPHKISGKIEPKPCRNTKGESGNFVFATPHRNAAIAYAFKPTDPKLNNAPLLMPEVQQEKTGSENPYAMIIGGNHHLYIRGLSLTGNLYTVPTSYFRPVACSQGEHASNVGIPIDECEHQVIKLEDTLGRNFNIWFANISDKFSTFVKDMVKAHPLEEYGRLVTDLATLEQAVSESILFKIDDQEIISRSGIGS